MIVIEKQGKGRIGIYVQQSTLGVTIVSMADYPPDSVRYLLQPGDVILEINNKKVINVKTAVKDIVRETSLLTLNILRVPDESIINS